MTAQERAELLARIYRTAQLLSTPALRELARRIENEAVWEAAITAGFERAKTRRGDKYPPKALLNYEHDWLAFAREIGLPQARATKFWTSILKYGRPIGSDKGEFLATEISVEFLLQRYNGHLLNANDKLLIKVWLLNLGWEV